MSFRSFPLLLLFACGSDGNTTSGKRVVLHTSATAATDKTQLTTGFGWDVTLTKAAIATSGFYYFDGPPPTAYVPPKRSFGERFASLFVGTAWAHPGHYQAGTALGQAIFATPTALDLFGVSPIALSDGDGVTGTYRSGRVLLPETAPADPVLAGHVGIAEGKATKHDGSSAMPIFFRLVADYADVSTSIQNGAVDGCVLDEAIVTENGSINMVIEPKVWLDLVDFSKIAPGSEGAPTEARDAGFSQGVTELSAYHFTYSK